MTLHPDAAAFLKAMENIPQPPEATVQEFRDAAARLVRTDPPLEIGSVMDATISGGDGQPLRLRIYTPEGDGPFPAAVWTRGGSFTRTTIEQMDPLRRATAKFVGCVVIAVDQRLSPEAAYPDPLNDAEAALLWTFANADDLRLDSARIGVGGESSGGNLAAALAGRRHRGDGPAPAFQFLFAPLVDASLSSPSIEEFEDGFVLTKRQLVWAYEQYARGTERTDPEISPLLASDYAGMAPAAIVTIENDPVRDEGELYARRLEEAGVLVKHVRIDGMVHHFPGPDAMPKFFGVCRDLLASMD